MAARWQCISGCGACCNLTPSDRPELAEYLTPEALTEYLSLVGEDGWCIHYDSGERRCTIYENRPQFCRVLPTTFAEMFGVTGEEFEDFVIDCCEQQIEGVYGKKSDELKRFCQATSS